MIKHLTINENLLKTHVVQVVYAIVTHSLSLVLNSGGKGASSAKIFTDLV
jgi:hypothetical protein